MFNETTAPTGTSNSRSSPTQIPGTTWSKVAVGNKGSFATKTDGTLWAWGRNNYGHLGQNSNVDYSSPVQVPGTSWTGVISGAYYGIIATQPEST